MTVVALCPTRGRPHNAREVQKTLESTRAFESTRVIFIVDDDDPALEEYRSSVPDVWIAPHGTLGMTRPLNWASGVLLMSGSDVTLIGAIGDDNRFRTQGWDARFLEVLQGLGGKGVLYGHDKHRIDIPTAWFVSANIVRALGWIAQPACQHLYLDNSWKVLGDMTETIHLVPSVIIEHLHPFFQTAPPDEGYARVNAPEMYERDRAAFDAWRFGEGIKIEAMRIARL